MLEELLRKDHHLAQDARLRQGKHQEEEAQRRQSLTGGPKPRVLVVLVISKSKVGGDFKQRVMDLAPSRACNREKLIKSQEGRQCCAQVEEQGGAVHLCHTGQRMANAVTEPLQGSHHLGSLALGLALELALGLAFPLACAFPFVGILLQESLVGKVLQGLHELPVHPQHDLCLHRSSIIILIIKLLLLLFPPLAHPLPGVFAHGGD
mmetsp:Transcript_45964/g.123508  ORF Transcript_45964/g.123508 Transcript_45964/m.123508 type:complete len:207 (-) Transcript_45964:152-772(-)